MSQNTNLPDYIRQELEKCQNVSDCSKLLAVVKHLVVIRCVELDVPQKIMVSQLGVTQQRISQIKNNTLKEAN